MKFTLKHVLAASILTLISTAQLSAGPWEDAVAASGRGDYEAAFRFLSVLAEQGDTDAQVLLGNYYAIGRGVPVNIGWAYAWFALAASLGDKKGENARYDTEKEMLSQLDPTSKKRLLEATDLFIAAWKHRHPQHRTRP